MKNYNPVNNHILCSYNFPLSLKTWKKKRDNARKRDVDWVKVSDQMTNYRKMKAYTSRSWDFAPKSYAINLSWFGLCHDLSPAHFDRTKCSYTQQFSFDPIDCIRLSVRVWPPLQCCPSVGKYYQETHFALSRTLMNQNTLNTWRTIRVKCTANEIWFIYGAYEIFENLKIKGQIWPPTATPLMNISWVFHFQKLPYNH